MYNIYTYINNISIYIYISYYHIYITAILREHQKDRLIWKRPSETFWKVLTSERRFVKIDR